MIQHSIDQLNIKLYGLIECILGKLFNTCSGEIIGGKVRSYISCEFKIQVLREFDGGKCLMGLYRGMVLAVQFDRLQITHRI